jgi:hypothetical protein
MNSALPQDYRQTAEALFPPAGGAGGRKEALAFAGILGIDADFRTLLDLWEADSERSAETEKFFHSFQNNLSLLIQKTWVEKTDEDRKERLLNRVPALVDLIKNGGYAGALREFGEILEELAWLLFGIQSRKDDFIEYAIRIDSQIGLFWWYGGQIGRVYPELKDNSVIRLILLLGLCYLAGF